MTIEEATLEKLRSLPPDKQQEALDFVEFLASRSQPKRPRKGLMGLWSDLHVDITAEDIDEAPREMWDASDKGKLR